jgi:hypothetical protein
MKHFGHRKAIDFVAANGVAETLPQVRNMIRNLAKEGKDTIRRIETRRRHRCGQ